ncbi:MAG TPA: FecR family protein [Kofleriaceae bacterium]|jgi:hypothetical protein
MTLIEVAVPASEARRARVEDAVIAQVATLRAADRADAAVIEPRSHMRLVLGLALAGAAAAAAIVVFVATRGEHEPGVVAQSSPSLVVTPVGGSSRFTVGDAVVDAGPDTSVEVRTDPGGAVTLALARGSVDCDVAPRGDRPPFRVIAGDVTVEVVGTRFTVARTPAVRVDVARGKVKVIGPTGTAFVAAGESWPVAVAEVPAPPPAPPSHPVPVAAPVHPAPSPQATFDEAQRLRATDPAKAERLYRALAADRGVWAALALYDLADMQAAARPDDALREVGDLMRRFPDAANIEDAAWLRIDILRKAGRRDQARRAAADYLRRFPSGTYIDQAARVAEP